MSNEDYLTNLRQSIAKIKTLYVDKNEQRQAEQNLLAEASKHYASKLGIDEKIALKALEDILPKSEKPIDFEENVKRCMAAVRMISPKVMGLESRENDNLIFLRHATNELDKFSTAVNALDKRVNLLNVATSTLTKVVAETHDHYYRIPKISYLFRKCMEWILVKLKT